MAGVACQGIWDRGGCLRCGGFRWGGFRWGGFRVGGSCEVGWTAAGWLCRCSRGPRVQGVVGVAHSRASGVDGNRGITRNSNVGSGSGSGSGHAPMCVDPLIAHGSPTTTHNDRPKISSFQQKPALAPQKPRPPMCNIEDNQHPPGTPTAPRTEIGPLPARDRSDSARPTRRRDAHDELEGESRMPHLRTSGEQQPRGSTTDLDTESDRSRREFRPISARKRTDLDASFDRFRRGSGPISVRKRTDLGVCCSRLDLWRLPSSSWPCARRSATTSSGCRA